MKRNNHGGASQKKPPISELSYFVGEDEWKVKLQITRYYNNGNLAIILTANSETKDELFACITVNLDDILMPNQAYLDINNCVGIERFVLDNKLGKPAGRKMTSGFVTYPLYEFDLERCKLFAATEQS